MAGRFITFEGGEGSGKSTQARRLAERLKAGGVEVIETREPGGSAFAERVRALILDPSIPAHGPLSEAFLFGAARADHLAATIRPALAAGRWVVCDRFADSTRVYQGAAGGLDPAVVRQLEDIVVGPTKPDLTVLLDIDAAAGLARAQRRRGGESAFAEDGSTGATQADGFERRNLDFHERLRAGFLALAAAEPARVAVIDASGDVDAIAEAVWREVSARLAPGARRALTSRMTERLIGQDAAEQRLAETFAAGRMHHAWLLTGPEGIGKATLAWRAARYALARPDDRKPGTLDIPRESPAARQVAALSHPSLLLIRRPYDLSGKRFPTVIPVDEVRKLKDFLAHSADAGTWRVIVVDRADEMNPSAANALLKSLEEPPARALFLLISSMPGRLLPTIRSRCRTLALEPLSPADLAAAARQAQSAAGKPAIPDGELDRLAPLAQGSVRRLLGLIAVGGGDIHGTLIGLLGTLPKLDRARVHALADGLLAHGADAKYQAFLELWSDTLAALVRAAATGGEGDIGRLATRIVAPDRIARWAEAWERTQSLRAETELLNLDRKALILELFGLAEAAARA